MRCLILLSCLILSGCFGYRDLPLQNQVIVVQKNQEVEILKTTVIEKGLINEESAIKLALAFNPDIRIPLIRDRGYGESEVQFRGVARPELHVTKESATVGLNVDMLSLYNLLSYTERVAWREMRRAERAQVYAEQTGAVVRLTRDVKLGFLDLARLSKQEEILKRDLAFLLEYKVKIEKKIDNPGAIIISLSEAELRQKIDKVRGEIVNSKLTIVNLLGVDPEREFSFDIKDTLNVSIMPEIKTIREMTKTASENNWKLISLSSQYIRKEYELRQAYLRRWGQFSVGPSVTFIPGDTTAVASFRVRIPWPSHSEDNIKDVTDERALVAARYTAALHDLQSDIMKQYNEMRVKWESIKNPRISVEWVGNLLADEIDKIDIHTYLDTQTRLFSQELYQLDEVAKYKMAKIILDSLLK